MNPQSAEGAGPGEVAASVCLRRATGSIEPIFVRTWRRGAEALRAAMRGFFARGARNIALQYHRLDRKDDDEESQR